MALPPRLAIPAKLLFDALNKANVRAILIGGAAIKLNGGPRDTKDLEIDVSSFFFKDYLSKKDFYVRAADTSRLRVTYLDQRDSVRCDFAMRREYIDSFYRYSRRTPDGICYALPNLLLAYKICSIAERPMRAVGKHDADLTDMEFLIGAMMRENQQMPSDISATFLTDRVKIAFKAALPHDVRKDYLELLSYVGVHILVGIICILYDLLLPMDRLQA